MADNKAVVDVEIQVPAGATAGSFTQLSQLDGSYKIVSMDGSLTSANGTGASRFIGVSTVRANGVTSGSIFGSIREASQALSASSPAGTVLVPGTVGTGSFNIVGATDSIKVTSGADTGAAELHFKLVRI